MTDLLGLTMTGFSITKIAIFLLMVGFQVYRAFREEKLLVDFFHGYADYALVACTLPPLDVERNEDARVQTSESNLIQ
ncbi:hypothetical protein SBDP1_420033 [Syntrophobacter sp. SbD1]|nr:hypothetical protein SBDP1_420033 [Syntrophobacter sp. SbD1]